MAYVQFIDDGLAARLSVHGEWTVTRAADIDRALKALKPDTRRLRHVEISVDSAERVDTTGAWLLLRTKTELEAAGVPTHFTGLSEDQRVLFDAVAARSVERPALPPPSSKVLDALAETGKNTRHALHDFLEMLDFFGEVLRAILRTVRDPSRLRFTSTVTQMERAGLNALPIVCLMSFLIGGIIAQQGAFQLRSFGAEVFVVNLVGILVLREVGLLLAAIMFAGRSGSATTAEIGSMKMREEIDAMRVIGLDPVEVLALPRLTALILALPLVTVLGNLAALAGALITCWLYIGMEPHVFLDQLQGALVPRHLYVGLVKAPFMGLIIGVISCVEGLRVEGSTESLGQHTTESVVKAIFMVIVVDGIFAMVFAGMGI